MTTTAVILSRNDQALPATFLGRPEAYRRAAEFFTAELRSDNTRRAYLNAARRFAGWCADKGVSDLSHIETVHVAAYIKSLEESFSVPSVKQHLAALKHLFDYLVTGGIIKVNPAAAVRGPRYSAAEGKTPILTGDEPRRLLESIETDSLVGLRDRAFIGLLLYTACRVNAAASLKVEDYYSQGASWFLRLREKGGKHHVMPCNHHLQEYLAAYIAKADIGDDPKGPLFRTLRRGAKNIGRTPLSQGNVYELIQRRKKNAGIKTPEIGCHSMRGTAITNLLENGASVEEAQLLANHSSIRTTKLYDHRSKKVRRDLVERIRF